MPTGRVVAGRLVRLTARPLVVAALLATAWPVATAAPAAAEDVDCLAVAEGVNFWYTQHLTFACGIVYMLIGFLNIASYACVSSGDQGDAVVSLEPTLRSHRDDLVIDRSEPCLGSLHQRLMGHQLFGRFR